MAGDHMTTSEKEYDEKYGHIPSQKDEIIKFMEENLNINMEKVLREEERIKNIEWKEVNFELPIIPTASPRPRYSSKTETFYVKGAAARKKEIKKYIKSFNIIYTSVELTITTYQPIPTGMSKTEMYLAEKGLIRPTSKPDWDNLGKTYSDMIQNILILNDNIITSGTVEKYYSIKPRVGIKIRYQDGWDSNYNRRRTEKTTAYINLMENTNTQDSIVKIS